ncbi:hypothetical protein [Methylobacterium organophilum]|uniref:Uncharacterized protein n=1 Tax=Methylobacterium organophilum TaxID=410 RepID=A0ABQ4T5P1_METOR|nr:hypothetical protein [Methylobacterium organophilum]UMY17006.1 hypothetical protein MMB17_20530 [Methylobacterium organophilum]GJE26970.1 hypothetical protein LKMONMHP_1824 [Methylobacterium organophilum]
MSKINIRRDERGFQAVYSGTLLLMDGLAPADAENFAAFFRASARQQGLRAGHLPQTPATRSTANRLGATR